MGNINKIKDLLRYLDNRKDYVHCDNMIEMVVNWEELNLLIDGLKVLGYANKPNKKDIVDINSFYPKCFKCKAACLGNEIFCNKCTRDMQDNVRELCIKGIKIPPIVKTNDYNNPFYEEHNKDDSELATNKGDGYLDKFRN